MTFDDSITIEKIASPQLNEWYTKNFRDLIAIIDVSNEKEFQPIGIDKFLVLKTPEIAKLVMFSIDEKVRTAKWNDFIAEIWSKKEQDIPGWVWTSRADYIVYAFYDYKHKQLFEPPRFIPTIDFVYAIKLGNYPEKQARNLGWTTIFKVIPEKELQNKPPASMTLADFVWGKEAEG